MDRYATLLSQMNVISKMNFEWKNRRNSSKWENGRQWNPMVCQWFQWNDSNNRLYKISVAVPYIFFYLFVCVLQNWEIYEHIFESIIRRKVEGVNEKWAEDRTIGIYIKWKIEMCIWHWLCWKLEALIKTKKK